MVKSHISLGKRGNLFDFVTVGRFFLVAVIVGFIAYSILTHFSTSIAQVSNTDNYTEFIESSRDTVSNSVDWGTLLFLVAALIFSVIAARKVPTEPLFIGIVLFMSFAFFIISFNISNVFGGLMDNVSISNYVNLYMPISKILLQYFPFVTAIYIGVVLIVFFGKND